MLEPARPNLNPLDQAIIDRLQGIFRCALIPMMKPPRRWASTPTR